MKQMSLWRLCAIPREFLHLGKQRVVIRPACPFIFIPCKINAFKVMMFEVHLGIFLPRGVVGVTLSLTLGIYSVDAAARDPLGVWDRYDPPSSQSARYRTPPLTVLGWDAARTSFVSAPCDVITSPSMLLSSSFSSIPRAS